MLSNVSGVGGSLMRAQPKYVQTYPVPLPPLAEQQRIVDRIERLLSKLDAAKELAQSVLDSFEDRKTALLIDAFSGKITELWRREHGLNINSWKEHITNDLLNYVTSGSRGWAKYYADDGAIFFRMGNLDHGTIDLDLKDVRYVCIPSKAEGQRSRVQKGDILISITADVGMVGLVKEAYDEAYINQHVALARPKHSLIDAAFFTWFLVSYLGLNQLKRKQRGATKVGLGLDDIRNLYIRVPLIEEQQEIVRILDSFFEKEQHAKELCEKVLDKIEHTKKSILARAFRGDLGTNDPNEENALELLKQVLGEQD